MTGNIKADELAKLGISSKSCYWQKLLKAMEPEESLEIRIARESRKSDAQQVKESRKSDVQPTKNFDCGVCKEPVSDDGIQCGDCKLWYHYTCSKLPSYQLYLYEKSQRKYTCEECSTVDGDFSRKYENMVSTSRMEKAVQALIRAECEITKPISTSCCAEVGTQILIEHRDNSIQTELRSTKDKGILLEPENRKKTPVLQSKDKETQTPNSFTSINKCLTEFQDGTIQRLENSFVNAVDNFAKVHNKTADLRDQIRKLTQEKDTLKLQKQQASSNQDTKKCSCQTLQSRVESLEKETERLKQQCFTVNMEKEIEVSKQKGAMTILNQKYESAKAQVEILHQDLETMTKRLKTKNDVILDLEEKVKKQNDEMLQLQDEIMSWKMHASRKDDTLLPTSNSERHVINMTSAESLSQGGREDKKKTNDHEHIYKQKAKDIEDVIDVEKNTDKKKVLLLGTSNTRFINTSYLSSSKVEVEKALKYKLNEAQKYIDAFKAEDKNADAFVLHLLDNDITEETPELCSEKLHQLCAVIKQKAKDSEVIVSMGLPRRDEATNRKINKLNVLLQEKLGDMENVHLCDNSNLFY